MGLLSRMKDAGLGRALKESRRKLPFNCLDEHARFASKQAYNYCPHCGLKLEVKHHCEQCGKNYFSDKAWETHQRAHLGLLPARCVCKAHGQSLERISEIRWRCRECDRIFDWVPKLTRNLNSPKVAKVVFEPKELPKWRA